MHGIGTYTWPLTGDRYIGEFREGLRHGKGEYIFGNHELVSGSIGCKYSGDWKDNIRHGRGIFTWKDGSIYDGDWEGNKRHGRGELYIASSGFRYIGNWENNKMVK